MTLTTEDIIPINAMQRVRRLAGEPEVGPLTALTRLSLGEAELHADGYATGTGATGVMEVDGQRFRVTVERDQ